ncbi:MAG: YidC/Oxa1 family membrane protein insertase [Acholeplasmataceae bacterium]|nr:YidC/Oxa1 family membrane protein insertase [Acholeplasmataceae bacterium]
MSKHYKQLLFIVMIFFLVFTLAACRKQPNVGLLVVNSPYGQAGEKLVYDYDQRNSIDAHRNEDLTYWELLDSGVVPKDAVVYEGNLPSNPVPTEIGPEGGIQTYFIMVDGKEISFSIYIKPEVDIVDDEIVMIAFRFPVNSVLYQQGQRFKPEGIEAYAVQKDGNIVEIHNELSETAFAALFDDGNYDPVGSSGFKNQISYGVSFTYEGFTKEFEVYVAGGERPVSTKDAKFFDYILVIPIAFLTQLFASWFGFSFAVGILLTTIVVRTLAWPIYAKTNDMSLKMNIAQPELQRVQQKYAHRKDPQSQQMMQMETIAIYKKHGINILGCLMPLLQMPIFIAMYNVVRRISLEGGMYADQVRNTIFLGIDLSKGNDGLIGMILAGIVGVTMFLLQRISQKKPSYVKNTYKHNQNPQAEQTEKTMKYVSYFMVIMMVVFSYQSNALALYWVFGNIYSLGQTIFNRKLNEKKHERLRQQQLMG